MRGDRITTSAALTDRAGQTLGARWRGSSRLREWILAKERVSDGGEPSWNTHPEEYGRACWIRLRELHVCGDGCAVR